MCVMLEAFLLTLCYIREEGRPKLCDGVTDGCGLLLKGVACCLVPAAMVCLILHSTGG